MPPRWCRATDARAGKLRDITCENAKRTQPPPHNPPVTHGPPGEWSSCTRAPFSARDCTGPLGSRSHGNACRHALHFFRKCKVHVAAVRPAHSLNVRLKRQPVLECLCSDGRARVRCAAGARLRCAADSSARHLPKKQPNLRLHPLTQAPKVTVLSIEYRPSRTGENRELVPTAGRRPSGEEVGMKGVFTTRD